MHWTITTCARNRECREICHTNLSPHSEPLGLNPQSVRVPLLWLRPQAVLGVRRAQGALRLALLAALQVLAGGGSQPPGGYQPEQAAWCDTIALTTQQRVRQSMTCQSCTLLTPSPGACR